MGLTKTISKQQEAMTPEVEALVAKAKEEAKRAGKPARRGLLDNRPNYQPAQHRRRGVVRL